MKMGGQEYPGNFFIKDGNRMRIEMANPGNSPMFNNVEWCEMSLDGDTLTLTSESGGHYYRLRRAPQVSIESAPCTR